ncbi:protein OXIDATIVE STRESS 3-like [Malania oleifera]|uniref:protein OXIDATIVE STRESS 3-like n=1 Tax=Malania oleifera TaxID=397392 RepID=UPI0025ADD28C|nr:protein OXIDATIVE STRESS 3-like [Malania oleifera]
MPHMLLHKCPKTSSRLLLPLERVEAKGKRQMHHQAPSSVSLYDHRNDSTTANHENHFKVIHGDADHDDGNRHSAVRWASSSFEDSAAASSITGSSSPSSSSSDHDWVDDAPSSSSSSSTSCPSSSSPSINGPLHELSELMAHLATKPRGLSAYYKGKSQSFTCLSMVRSIEDLPKRKPPSSYRRKMKAWKSYGAAAGLDSTHKLYCNISKATIAKKASRGYLPPSSKSGKELF